MGSFDRIHIKIPCHYCKEPIWEWQSKQYACQFMLIPFNWVNEFHSICDKCRKWNQYEYKHPIFSRKLSDYKFVECED